MREARDRFEFGLFGDAALVSFGNVQIEQNERGMIRMKSLIVKVGQVVNGRYKFKVMIGGWSSRYL